MTWHRLVVVDARAETYAVYKWTAGIGRAHRVGKWKVEGLLLPPEVEALRLDHRSFEVVPPPPDPMFDPPRLTA